MREFIKKHENIKVFLLLFIPVIVFTSFLIVIDGDEMYNFQSVSKMANGYTIYKDFNVIITPLFFWIGELLFKIFGNYLLVFRAYSVVIHMALYYSFYYLLKKLNVSQKMTTNGLLAFVMISMALPFNGANYNSLALFFYILGFILVLNKPSTKNSFLIGFVAFLTFLTKQNMGVYFVIATIIAQVINHKKESIKPLIIEFITGLVLVLIASGIMLMQGNFWDMIDYAFLNLTSFAGNNFIIQKATFTLVIISIMVIACVEILFVAYVIKTKKKEYISLLIFGAILILVALPIVNMYHVKMAATLVVAEFIIMFDKLLENNMTEEEYKEFIKKNKLLNINTLILFLDGIFFFIALSTMLMQFASYIDIKFVTDENVYKYTFVESETIEDLERMEGLMREEEQKGNRVVILSSKAAIYMSYFKINNGDMDLPFNGNLGKDGVDGLIQKLKDTENLTVLIDMTDPFWQIPEELRDFVIKHYKKIDMINDFYYFERLNIPFELLDANSQ